MISEGGGSEIRLLGVESVKRRLLILAAVETMMLPEELKTPVASLSSTISGARLFRDYSWGLCNSIQTTLWLA